MKNAIAKAALELESSHVCEKRSNFHRKYKHKEQGSSDQATNKQAEATDQPTNYLKTFGEACLWLLVSFWGTTLLYFTISSLALGEIFLLKQH